VEEIMDNDGYPENEELEKIKQWDCTKDGGEGLLNYVRILWHWPEFTRKEGDVYVFVTGGWSGNEELIGAMRRNSLFWALCWMLSKRGGRHEFIPYKIQGDVS
jgi:hypothetical protein